MQQMDLSKIVKLVHSDFFSSTSANRDISGGNCRSKYAFLHSRPPVAMDPNLFQGHIMYVALPSTKPVDTGP